MTWPGPAWHGMARHDMAWPRMAQPRSTGHSPRHPELQQQHGSQPCHGRSSHAHVHVPVPIHKHDPPAKRVNTPPQRAPPSPRVCAHAAHMCNPTHEHTHGHACAHVQHAPRPPPPHCGVPTVTPTCTPPHVCQCPGARLGVVGGHTEPSYKPHTCIWHFSALGLGGSQGKGTYKSRNEALVGSGSLRPRWGVGGVGAGGPPTPSQLHGGAAGRCLQWDGVKTVRRPLRRAPVSAG